MRVPVEIKSDGNGGLIASCTECNHEVTCKGESERSVNRCMALMREQCPEGKENFYVEDE
jgi:hypothetical protein